MPSKPHPNHPGHAHLARDLAAAKPDPKHALRLRVLGTAAVLNQPLNVQRTRRITRWLTDLEEYHGGGLHPDTPFTDYVCLATGRRTWSTDEAALLQRVFDRVCAIVDVYSVLLPLAQARGTR